MFIFLQNFQRNKTYRVLDMHPETLYLAGRSNFTRKILDREKDFITRKLFGFFLPSQPFTAQFMSLMSMQLPSFYGIIGKYE